ncbi:MAG: hypothetical protein E7340_02145 [Clostridiales bacterium]|nr:hypothetical protein [Clostridiales bacterium]
MKKLLALLMSICIAFTAFAGVGCKGNEGSNDPNVLEIYCYIQGFGSTWLEENIKLFKEQDWVKEKYPDLKVQLETNSNSSFASNRLQNQKTNTYDLFFGSHGIDKLDPSFLVNLTDTVYMTEVPGQPGELIMNRVPQLAREALYEPEYEKVEIDGEKYDSYYGFKYVYIFYSWMYNKTLFDKLAAERGWELPVTTEEMFNICDNIKSQGYDYSMQGRPMHTNTPIMHTSKNGGYATSQFPVYWVQYEGYDQYENFYTYGSNEEGGMPTNEIFAQKGRLRSLETIEETYQNYAYEDSAETDFKKGQGAFLAGEGIFHWNGDYFTTEMQLQRDAARRGGGEDYEIVTMKTPVLSQLVERLSFYQKENPATEVEKDSSGKPYTHESFNIAISSKPYKELTQENKNKYDAVLAAMIRDIDEGIGYDANKDYAGYKVTEQDWKIVKEARTYNASRTLPGQAAVIPQSTPAKAIAIDFLRFFYTDVAIEKFGVASKGLSFPVIYYEKLDQEAYDRATETFEPEAKTKYDLMYGQNGNNVDCGVIPAPTQFLFGKCGLEHLKGYNGNLNKDMVSMISTRYTAQKIFEMDIDYWKGDNWTSVVNQVESSAN